jgi:uncharacterized protein YuzE
MKSTEIFSQKNLGENIVLDLDFVGNIVGIEILQFEHNKTT